VEKLLESIFKENFHELVFFSLRIVNDYDQAQDIVQNVFIKLWQNQDKIKHISKLKPYVFKAVKNSSLNFLRDKKLTDKNIVDIQDTKIEYHEGDEQELDTAEMLRIVHETVDKLPEKWREAFILSKYESLKYNEIAKKMDISDKTVEKYIAKALTFLRKELKHMFMTLILIFFK